MKTVTWKLLLLKKKEKVLKTIWEYCTDSFFIEFSVGDAPDEDRTLYGASTEMVTIRALSVYGVSHQKNEFEGSLEFLQEEYASTFVDKGIAVTDPAPADKARFNTLFPPRVRRNLSCAEVTS